MNTAEADQVVWTVFAKGIFIMILQASGVSDATSQRLLNIIPASWRHFDGLMVAFLSGPDDYFLYNEAFYYGIMPVLAEAGLRLFSYHYN